MGLETFTNDDGSTYTIERDASGAMAGMSSTPASDNGVYGWSQDNREAQKFAQFYPADKPWWEGLAMYGATRAIDSHFRRTETDKTAQPVTFAGQNGKTYAAGNTAPQVFAGLGGVVLLGVAVLGVLAVLSRK